MGKRLSHSWSIIRNFLLAVCNKQFLFFLFFLVLSGIFWLLVTLNDNYEMELDFPVELVNVPKNAVITSDVPDTVTATVYDKGFLLMSYYTNHRPKTIKLNFESYANKNTGRGLINSAELQRLVRTQIMGSSRLNSVKPEKLEFYFNFGQSKRVPVRLVGKVTAMKNFYISKQVINPQKIVIYANRQLLDSVRYVVADINIVNVQDTISRRVKLRSIKGVKMIPDSVDVKLCTDVLTEESIEVPIKAVNMPEGKVLRTFPSRVKVSFTVGASQFRSVKPEMFSVEVDYKELETNPSDKCNIYLRLWPRFVSKCRLEIPQVDYLIEQQ